MDRPETTPDDPRLVSLRRKTTGIFLGGVGLGTIGLIAAMIVSSLAAAEISHAATWSGLPSALSILGTATGTTLLAEAMERWGRRRGLLWSYSVATLGAAGAIGAMLLGSLPLLVAAMFTIGLGRSGDALSRYLVADLYPPGRRASAIGWMVWVGTIGAVVGPNSLAPAGRMASRLGLPQLSGAFLITLGAYGLVVLLYFIFLRPDPSTLIFGKSQAQESPDRAPLLLLFRPAPVRVALAVLIVGHMVMVLIMTMTPLHLKLAGHGLDAVGLVMSSHIIGMFVFSPVTGRLVDRWGPLPIIYVAQITLLTAAIAALVTPASAITLMALALFLLGLGWNLGFVAGSALLSTGQNIHHRARLQGVSDSMIWSSAALASVTSGLVLSLLGYGALCMIGALLLVIPATILLRYRRSLLHSRRRG